MGNNRAEYEIYLKDSFSKTLSGADKSFTQFEKKVQGFSGSGGGGGKGFNMSLASMAGGVARFAGAMGLAFGAAGVIKGVVSLGAEFEQTQISFETMLGSADKANSLIKDIQATAAKTPFDSVTLSDQAKLLLNFGSSADKIIPTLTMLGDVAGGNKQRFEALSLAFAQSQAQGRLMGQDLMQMVNAGFNPLQVIAEKTGKSMGTLKDEMSKGLIPFAMVEQAFKDASSEGGRFFNLMEKQSHTLAGRWSTLVDNVQLLGIKIGMGLNPTLGKFVDATSKLLNNLRPMNERFKEQNEAFLKTSSSLEKMVSEYDTLKGKSELTADEQKRLNDLIQDISNIVPSAVTQWDAYGNALDINKDKLKDFTKLNRDAMNVMNAKAIKEQQNELYKMAREAFNLQNTLNRGTEDTGGGGAMGVSRRKIDNEREQELRSQYRGFAAQGTGLIAKTIEEIRSLGASKIDKSTSDLLNRLGYKIPDLLAEAAKDTPTGGTDAGGALSTGTNGGKTAGAAGVEKISGGGIKNITVNVTKLVETINFHTNKFENGTAQMVEEVKKALLTALNDVNIVSN
jgi:tape measure domain-containing protein